MESNRFEQAKVDKSERSRVEFNEGGHDRKVDVADRRKTAFMGHHPRYLLTHYFRLVVDTFHRHKCLQKQNLR